MKPGNSVVSVRMMLFITLVLLTAMSGTAMSACIPEGAYVESATFSVYVTGWGQTVQLHRITAPWLETEVTWNNFGGTYAPDVAGSLTAPKGGEWRSVDVTALVQGWVDGSYPNYGVLLEQDQANAITFASSENTPVDRRPKLQITYVTLDGSASVTIQRPGPDQDGVADAYIWGGVRTVMEEMQTRCMRGSSITSRSRALSVSSLSSAMSLRAAAASQEAAWIPMRTGITRWRTAK